MSVRVKLVDAKGQFVDFSNWKNNIKEWHAWTPGRDGCAANLRNVPEFHEGVLTLVGQVLMLVGGIKSIGEQLRTNNALHVKTDGGTLGMAFSLEPGWAKRDRTHFFAIGDSTYFQGRQPPDTRIIETQTDRWTIPQFYTNWRRLMPQKFHSKMPMSS